MNQEYFGTEYSMKFYFLNFENEICLVFSCFVDNRKMEIDEEYYNVQDVNNTSKRLSSQGICMKMEWKRGGINNVIESAFIHIILKCSFSLDSVLKD